MVTALIVGFEYHLGILLCGDFGRIVCGVVVADDNLE
jgi:hypothetical protein